MIAPRRVVSRWWLAVVLPGVAFGVLVGLWALSLPLPGT